MDTFDKSLEAPTSTTELWSRYKRIQDIVVNPIQPLLVLIGSPAATASVRSLLL